MHTVQAEPRDVFDLAALDTDEGAALQLEIQARGLRADLGPSDVWVSATSFTEPGGVEPDDRYTPMS